MQNKSQAFSVERGIGSGIGIWGVAFQVETPLYIFLVDARLRVSLCYYDSHHYLQSGYTCGLPNLLSEMVTQHEIPQLYIIGNNFVFFGLSNWIQGWVNFIGVGTTEMIERIQILTHARAVASKVPRGLGLGVFFSIY